VCVCVMETECIFVEEKIECRILFKCCASQD